MILFAIKKRILTKHQPLNLCSLTKPSPSPGAPRSAPSRSRRPPRIPAASPSPAGKKQSPSSSTAHPAPQRRRDAPSRRGTPSASTDRPGDAAPSPATWSQHHRHRQPSRSSSRRPSPKSSSPGTVQQERRRDGDGEREKRRSDRITHSFSAPAHKPRTPARQQRPQLQPTPGEISARSRARLAVEALSAAPFQFCFWRENRTGARKPRKNTGERRPPADAAHQRKGEPLHFGLQRLSQISTQYHHHHTLTPKISSVARSV